ncbi:MAG TPA: hypothetical protein VM557_13305 [Thermoanaerobaculia bacterium]|nr:hypothetical protein [Thermoanaerobaculia bacterium]
MGRRFSLLLLFTLLATQASAQTTQPPTGEALMQALLVELRAIRQALTEQSAIELRARLLLQREDRQQRIVDELTREVDQRRNMMGDMTMEEPPERMTQRMEERLLAETDPQRRRDLEAEMSMMRQRFEMMKQHRDREAVRSQQMEMRLQDERGRLEDLRSEIDSLIDRLDR